MSFRLLLAPAAALAFAACATAGTGLPAAEAPHGTAKLDLHAPRAAFPALREDVALPSADQAAIHMQRILGDSAQAEIKVCVDDRGDVTSTSLVKSSGMAAYDRAVLDDVKAWKFEAPAGTGHCEDATIVYTLH